MKTAIFSSQKFEKDYLIRANQNKHELSFIEFPLNINTVGLAANHKAISIFVNDDASAPVLKKLKETGVEYIALRSAGYNHVDLKVAGELGIGLARVPEYSPYSVAEHTIALIMALNRKLIRAHNRVRDQNFSLNGLTGFDMNGKTVGVVGLGKIGKVLAKILHGFGCNLLVYELSQDMEFASRYNISYTDMNTLCENSDIITLHVPLNDKTKYIINRERIEKMKNGVMLINTSRGGLVDTKEVIRGLKSGKIGYLGIDVYEEEKGLFFEDFSEKIVLDDVITRLMTFPNVLITSHQAFLTETALENIADTTIFNLDCMEKGDSCPNEIK